MPGLFIWHSGGRTGEGAMQNLKEFLVIFGPVVIAFLAIFSVSAIFAGLKAFGRMGALVTGVSICIFALLGYLPTKATGGLLFAGVAVTGIFGYLLFFGVDSKRRR